ncbi:TPA: hypothetical protein I8W99_004525 [Aeromonas hydrophila]|nr:hypothetical protein [Aeromonas hydrophila]HAT1519081.1 hypothetical protein [Aeromonas hydrophila]
MSADNGMICTSLLNGEWIIGIVKWNPCGWLAGWLAGWQRLSADNGLFCTSKLTGEQIIGIVK